MNRSRNLRRILLFAALAAAGACSTKSPTEPSSQPSNPQTPAPTPTYTLVVSGKPSTITAGAAQTSLVTVTATNVNNGQPPPSPTPISLTTTLGTFGAAGQSSICLQLVNGAASTTLIPGSIAGTAAISATIDTAGKIACPASTGPCSANANQNACVGSGAGAVNITGTGTFFLNSVTPNTGDPGGGSTATINGGGFIAPVSVTFGNSSAPVQRVGPSTIVVTVPPSTIPVPVGTTLPVNVSVQNDVGGTATSSATLANAFIYVPGGGGVQQPQIFSVTPASGTNSGGTQVTITGQNFVSPVQVFFGTGTSASSFSGVEATVQSVTSTKIIVVSPPAQGFGQNNTNTLVSILVKNLASGFSTIDSAAFQYGSKVIVTSAGPTQTIYTNTAKVTIFGQGFQSPVAVSLAGIAADVLSTSGTEIQVVSGIPAVSSCANISGPVQVTNINNGDSGTGPTFTYLVPKPFVTTVTPVSIGQGGGTVTLTGGNFIPANDQVTIGQSAGSVQVGASSATSLVIIAPPFSGTFPTTPCTGPGGQTGSMDLPAAENIIVTDAATGCTTTLTGGLTYDPSNTGCIITVTPPTASFTDTVAPSPSLEVIFSDTSTGNPNTWDWNFGDGSAHFTGANPPPHTYPAPGTYAVTLTVSNSAGSSSFGAFVTVPAT